MRIAVLTINDNTNFGNRLQNYAVQHILSKYGTCENYSARFKSRSDYLKYLIWKISLKKVENIFPNKSFRTMHFYEFNKCIKYKKVSYKDEYDFYFYGSDQIWNPSYNLNQFINPETPYEKNFAFSASFGVSKIRDNQLELYKRGLSKFNKISVREDAGAELVHNIIGIKPTVLIDPTMYLDKTDWMKLEKKPDWYDGKQYILIYFLGNMSEGRINEVNIFSQENKCIIINLAEKKYENISPSEFIFLIRNCFIMITDSFHGSVFSILFRKPFVVFEREDEQESMNSRIETLLAEFGLLDCKRNTLANFDLEVDYSNVSNLINEEKLKVDKFLGKIFERKTC